MLHYDATRLSSNEILNENLMTHPKYLRSHRIKTISDEQKIAIQRMAQADIKLLSVNFEEKILANSKTAQILLDKEVATIDNAMTYYLCELIRELNELL